MRALSCFALLAATFLASEVAAQCRTITTLFARNNGGAVGGAIYFDASVKNAAGLNVKAFDINVSETTPLSMDVYVTPGTAVGNQTNMAVWNVVGSGSGVGQGIDNPTHVDTSDFALPPGDWGIALVLTDAGHDYTNGNGMNQNYSNADIELNLGSATNVPFTGNIFDPRVWNGTIYYEEAAECWSLIGPRTNQPITGGDILLVQPFVIRDMTLTNLPKFPIPNIQALRGIQIAAQGFMFNPFQYPNDPIKLSQGLEFTLGGGVKEYGEPMGLRVWATAPPALGGFLEFAFVIQ